MPLFKDNKEFDSTLVLGTICLAYLLLGGATVYLVIKSIAVPQPLADIFQGSKELMLLVAGYFFRKGQEAIQNMVKKD